MPLIPHFPPKDSITYPSLLDSFQVPLLIVLPQLHFQTRLCNEFVN